MTPTWIQLLDGSYAQACHITRLFINPDVTKRTFTVTANIGGPQMPHQVATYTDKDDAQFALDHLIAVLNPHAIHSCTYEGDSNSE
jgi:hypothetical protein